MGWFASAPKTYRITWPGCIVPCSTAAVAPVAKRIRVEVGMVAVGIGAVTVGTIAVGVFCTVGRMTGVGRGVGTIVGAGRLHPARNSVETSNPTPHKEILKVRIMVFIGQFLLSFLCDENDYSFWRVVRQ
jgi:hypothetical protein